MNIRIIVELDNEQQVELNDIEHNLVVTGITFNSRLYYDLEGYSKRHKESVVNVRRKKQLVPSINCSQYYLRIGNKIYVSDALSQITEQQSNLYEVSGNWATYIGGFEWDYFGTVRYQNKYSLLTAKERAEKFFKKLKMKFKKEQIRMFYTMENNGEANTGFHMHFLLWVSTSIKDEVKSFTESHFRGKGQRLFANTHMVKYDPTQGAVQYMLKELHLHNNDSVDLLTHNL